jgi:hypothetical protein
VFNRPIVIRSLHVADRILSEKAHRVKIRTIGLHSLYQSFKF